MVYQQHHSYWCIAFKGRRILADTKTLIFRVLQSESLKLGGRLALFICHWRPDMVRIMNQLGMSEEARAYCYWIASGAYWDWSLLLAILGVLSFHQYPRTRGWYGWNRAIFLLLYCIYSPTFGSSGDIRSWPITTLCFINTES
jgi:hypothetical protein